MKILNDNMKNRMNLLDFHNPIQDYLLTLDRIRIHRMYIIFDYFLSSSSNFTSLRFSITKSLNRTFPFKYISQFSFLLFSPMTNEFQDGCVSGNQSLND